MCTCHHFDPHFLTRFLARNAKLGVSIVLYRMVLFDGERMVPAFTTVPTAAEKKGMYRLNVS